MMNRTTRILGVIVALLAAPLAWSQQDAQLSMYLRNPIQFNSAHAGTNGVLRTMVINRAQWVGWEGAPRTQWVSAHAPILRNRMGVGITALKDQSGARGHAEFMGHFAYYFPKPIHGFNLTTGLSMGVQSNRFDFSQLHVSDLNDPLQAAPYKEAAFNAGFGAMAYKDDWYVGLSIPHLLEQSMGFQGSGPVQRRHLYLMTGYIHRINSAVDLRGVCMVKKVSGAPFAMDVGVEAWFMERYSIGTMMRWKEGFGFQLSYYIDESWRVYYAVDFPLNGLADRNFGSHEIGVSWDFGFKRTAYQSPRYF